MEYLILIVTLAGIVFGADWLVAGAVSIARRFRVSDFVIGAAIVGIGTSMPELVVSFFGAIKGNADVAIGNVVGSNIFNVLGILGVTALFFPIAIDKQNMTFEIPLCIAVSVLVTLLAFNFFDGSPAVLGRLDGLVLILLFAGFMWYSFARDKKEKGERAPHEARGDEAIRREGERAPHDAGVIGDPTKAIRLLGDKARISISAKQGDISALKQLLLDYAREQYDLRNAVTISSTRHYEALLKAQAAIQRVTDGLAMQLSGEFLSMDLQDCLAALGEITGQITSQEVLNNIFSKFCIGK